MVMMDRVWGYLSLTYHRDKLVLDPSWLSSQDTIAPYYTVSSVPSQEPGWVITPRSDRGAK